jgi:hypothetical protein
MLAALNLNDIELASFGNATFAQQTRSFAWLSAETLWLNTVTSALCRFQYRCRIADPLI